MKWTFTAVSIFTLGNVVGVSASSSLQEITAYLDSNINLIVNGKPFTAKDTEGNQLSPINYNGNTYLPLRAVAEVAGMQVNWDDNSRTATLGTANKEQEIKKEPEQETVSISSDKTFQFTLPKNWIRNDQAVQNPLFKYGASNNTGKTTLILGVLSDDKSSFSQDYGISKYSQLIVDGMKKRLGDYKIKSEINLELNGYHAKRYEITGNAEGIYLSILVTLVETNNKYYQIMLFSASKEFENKDREEFEKITNTFKVLSN